MINKWEEQVPEDYFINWSSCGHKDEWATIVCDDKGWWHAWEYPHLKDCLKECLDDARWLLNQLLQKNDKKITITICQI